ncbi:Sec-independent protein translocase protein TatB [Gordonia humi]|uniref:Sec-independent protein translocase protein TatB n=1 Tax=Gordonia humi TaxID=686429 RepID=A0A840EZU2_9ACTN|nr:Sec-independent protein translocase protein TatB [Gordonia humi]MBB4135763.1 sec-independent protein translocase protein TatB [Gordonia humi]
MFSSIGWGEIVVLLAAGLIILGPERLPGAVTWTMQSIRKVRDYATGASGQLRDEMGVDFEQFREPIQQINELRQMNPRSAVTKHLFGGDSSSLDSVEELGRSFRDSFDIDGTATPSKPARPEPKAPELPAPEPAKPNLSKRSHDFTDWDAT